MAAIALASSTMTREKNRKSRSDANAPAILRPGDDLCTVAFAAGQLKVHQKTILRFVRNGRLKATKIGKSYRILRSDLEAFTGVAMPTGGPETASMTSIIDVPDVAPEKAKTWSRSIMTALNARTNRKPPLRADVIYEPERSHLKVVIVGAPADAISLLGLIRMWIEQ